MSSLAITLEDLFNLSDSVIYNPDDYKTVNKVSIDSRTITKNSIYVAIKGEKLDGHKFIKNAIAKGAKAIVINKRKLKNLDDVNITIVAVKDTVKAYGEIANIRRNKFGAKIISITGSNGKTSTKEILANILSQKLVTEKSIANNNNHIGVPLTILSTKKNCEALVIEHGTNHFGEIEFTSNIAKPDLALITNIGDSHLEFLIDREGVYKEKSDLLKHAKKVVVNTDDPIIKKYSKEFTNKVTYGFKGSPDIKGKIKSYNDDGQAILEVISNKKSFNVDIPLLGEANAKNVLAAITIAIECGLNKSQITKGVKSLDQIKGRLEVIKSNNNLIIDDTYNASPDSTKNAIELVKKIKSKKRKVLILGDMFELGKNGKKLHANLSEAITKSLEVYTIGSLMKSLANKINSKAKISKHFSERKKLISFISQSEFQNSVVLVKGSRGMKMEEFVEQLTKKAA